MVDELAGATLSGVTVSGVEENNKAGNTLASCDLNGAVFGIFAGEPMPTSLSGADAIRQLDEGGGAAGYALSSAGDFDGDGFEDLLIGVPTDDDVQNGHALLLYGPLSGMIEADNASMVLDGDGAENLGHAVLGGFDANGDGISDIAVGAPKSDGEDGQADLLFGGGL